MGYSENEATELYHAFTTSVYFMCMFGGILSDVWLGKSKTILILCIVCAIGSILVSISAVPIIKFSPTITLFTGLFLIAVGDGGIKPCVAPFGGDQFKMPEQSIQVATFFSVYYFSINLGSVVSTSITPILREDVRCFGQNDCFSLAFGVPAILMIIAICK